MKDLILGLKTRLNVSKKLTYLPVRKIGERNIFISADNRIPVISRYPAIAIKDGRSRWALAGGTLAAGSASYERRMNVRVTGFVQQFSEDERIITGSAVSIGILTFLDDIIDVLLGYSPDADLISPPLLVDDDESQTLTDPAGSIFVQQKSVVLQYLKQEDR